MKKIISFIVALVLLPTVLLSKDFNNKLSFETHIFLRQYEKIKTDTVNQKDRKNSLKDYSFQSNDSVSTAKLYVKINDVNIDKNFIQEELEKLDAKVLVRTKSVVLISIPINKIEELAELDFVRFIEISKRPKPLLDRALPSSKVGEVHQGTNLERSYFGEGVIVGVVDWGFDFMHPMFLDAEGNSRIVRAWLIDDDSGEPPGNSDVGTLYKDSQIKNFIWYSTKETHGSHVLGIAAGSEVVGKKGTYSGVASKSVIAVVDMGRFDAADEGYEPVSIATLEAVDYLFSYADTVNKPIAINLSFGAVGYAFHANDGQSLADIAMNELIDENPKGRIVVVAAGNEGGRQNHFEANFNENDSAHIWTNIIRSNSWNFSNSVSMWGEPNTSFSVDFYVKWYSNKYSLVSVNTENPKLLDTQITHNINGRNRKFDIILQSSSEHIINKRPSVHLNVIDYGYQNELYAIDALYFDVFATNTTVHGWNNNFATVYSNSNKVDVNSDYTIRLPGTAENVITVGAYVTREFGSGTVNNIAGFSSKGPLLDGSIKPDITAPGDELYSALNSFSDSFYQNLADDETLDGQYKFIGMPGTSMASPMVAGIIALMLEINPKLTVNEIKDIIRITAINDEWTDDAKNNKCPIWGWGKINAHAIMKNLETNSIEDFDNTISFTVYPNPVVNNEITISIFDTVCDLPFVVNIFDATGRLVFLSSMQQEKTFDISRLDSGFYFIKLDNGKQSSMQKIVLTK